MELLEWCSVCFKDDLVLKRVFLLLFVCVLDNNAELSYFLTGKTFSLQLQITWSLLLILVQFSEGNNACAFRMSACQFFHLNSTASESVEVALDLTDILNRWCIYKFCENQGCTKAWPSLCHAVGDWALPGGEGGEQTHIDNTCVPERFSEMGFSEQSPPLDVSNLSGISVT